MDNLEITCNAEKSLPTANVTSSECYVCCGAGGMVIAFAKVMLARGYNPQTQLRADCVDIDPVAARMCYIQLSLLGIPARVVIGNSLTLKYQREMYTPFWYRVTSKRWPMYR